MNTAIRNSSTQPKRSEYLLSLLGLLSLLSGLLLSRSVASLSAQTAESVAASQDDQDEQKQEWIQAQVHRLREINDIDIVMDYDSGLQWNPLFSYTASEAQIHIALFEGLLAYNPVDMTPRPGLAESWQVSNDGLRYTFTLRKNARFSNGDPIDANTVAQTWFFLFRSGAKAPFSSLLDLVAGVRDYRDGKISQEATGIQVRDAYQLELTLEHPGPEILAILCHHSLSPLPPSMLVEQDWPGFYRQLQSPLVAPSDDNADDAANGQATKQLVSNGPYRLKSVSEAGIELEANPYYWNVDEVASKTIFIQKYYDWQDWDISSALNSYKIDWVSSGFIDFNQLRRGPDMIHIGKSFGTTFFYFGGSKDPANSWSEPKVRKALALLLPLEKLRSGLGGDTYLIPEMPGFKSGEALEKQDQGQALQLLKEAGYPEGKGLGTLILRFPQGATYEQFVALIKEAWADLKCEIKVIYGDPTAMIAPEVEPPNFTLGVLSWIGDYPDPTTFLNLWRSDSSLNLFGHEDSDYDKLLDQAQQASDRKTRFQLLSEAEEHLLQNGTVIPLWHSPSFNLYDKRFLDGFYQNVLNLHPLHTLRRIYRLPQGSA